VDSPVNGVCDPPDAPVQGVTVTLNISTVLLNQIQTAQAALALQTTTDAGGLYTFANVSDGEYFVHFDLPSGYQFSPMATSVNTVTGDSPPFSLNVDNQTVNVDAPLAPRRPTAIELAGFGATTVSAAKCGNPSGAECVWLEWQTVFERNTAGFIIFRSTGTRETALPLSQVFIEATGAGSSYKLMDSDTQPNQTYVYWLSEVDINGSNKDLAAISIHVDGSLSDSNQPRIYLPTPLPRAFGRQP
jgi:hypothetical protein